VHPFCPTVHDGRLWAYLLKDSPKCHDLRRDGRYALHATQPEDVDDELMIRGTAAVAEVDDALRAGIITSALPASIGQETEQLFELRLDRVMLATYTHRGQWPPTYDRWVDAG
jgi:hypothetical protein